jgi:hypothetical protein
VGFPVPAPFFPLTDLSVQVVTVAPLEGGVPVPAGSFPSNQSTQPLTDVTGENVTVFTIMAFALVFVMIGILLLSV